MRQPVLFGVRHLSPGAAWQLRRKLDEVEPELILVEGPSDLSDEMVSICHPKAKPPLAMMAYTKDSPIQSILYPFSVYSPEYQAILWAKEHACPCRFMDLPAGVFLSLQRRRQVERDRERTTTDSVYNRLAELSGDEDHDTFWERRFEHWTAEDGYEQAVSEFGRQLRGCTMGADLEDAETVIREAYMKRQIISAIESGIAPERIVCVCGAYHVEGLESMEPMTEEEVQALPSVDCCSTLMPYSYYRLSTRAGYGAGNKAPAYFELLWQAMEQGDLEAASYWYLTRIANFQRQYGNMTSSAEVIEGVRLAKSLAMLRNDTVPCLQDLRDAAITCMGHGQFSKIALAAADTEIGSTIGELPEGVSRTSIQDDFYRQLSQLRLDAFKSDIAKPLDLDLREKLGVQSEAAAFMDVYRSMFLHRLRILGIDFAQVGQNRQERATWAETWTLRWTPEAEIQIVEAALLGDTIASAASFALRERAVASASISQATEIVQDAFLCGMPETVAYALEILQGLAIDEAAVDEIARAAEQLSILIRYGNLRRLDPSPLQPLVSQLFMRGCLTLPSACRCDAAAASALTDAMERLNTVALHHEFLEEDRWISVLLDISDRDDLNTKCSGFAAAILLERGKIGEELLAKEMARRLSRGIPADLGAGWFEGLAKKNRLSLIARLSLWRQLSEYLDALDEGEFRRALVFLRRAFADFSPKEKNDIAENLGEIWGVSTLEAADAVMRETTQEEKELLEGLSDFDFDDI